MKRRIESLDEFINESMYGEGVHPRDLVPGEKYTWLMGAEPLECEYIGKGTKPGTFIFKLDKSEHTLSIKDVKDFIAPLSFMDEK